MYRVFCPKESNIVYKWQRPSIHLNTLFFMYMALRTNIEKMTTFFLYKFLHSAVVQGTIVFNIAYFVFLYRKITNSFDLQLNERIFLKICRMFSFVHFYLPPPQLIFLTFWLLQTIFFSNCQEVVFLVEENEIHSVFTLY